MKSNNSKRKINIIDMLLLFLVAAVLIYAVVVTVSQFVKADDTINNKVELSFTLKNNVEFASVLKPGDTVYVFECTSPLGRIKSVNLNEGEGKGIIVVETGFRYDAPVYTVDGVTVTRGGEYKLRTLDFTADTVCTACRETAAVVFEEKEGE